MAGIVTSQRFGMAPECWQCCRAIGLSRKAELVTPFALPSSGVALQLPEALAVYRAERNPNLILLRAAAFHPARNGGLAYQPRQSLVTIVTAQVRPDDFGSCGPFSREHLLMSEYAV